MLELSIYVVVFILLSGLMSAVEAAVLNVTRGEVEELRAQQAWGAEALKKLIERITRPLVVLVIFTNTINVLGPILAGRKVIQIYGDVGIGMITFVLTIGTIVFSEIIPKSLGSHYAPLISSKSAPIIRFFIIALYPVVLTLEWFSGLLKTGQRPIGTEAQIRSLTTIGRREGYIENSEGQLVHRAFLLNDKSADSIMTPLEEVIAVTSTNTIREAAATVFRHSFSRYPVFGATPNDVIGLVMSRDILGALSEGKDQDAVTTITRDILTIPPQMRSDQLLVRFRDAHVHLAVVHDGRMTVGIVTLEDVLEQLVGEIEDEKDQPR